MINQPKEGVYVESTVLPEPELEIQESTEPPWTPCDSCQVARATWKIVGNSGELFLCGHHKNRHEPKLASWAKEIVDLGVL